MLDARVGFIGAGNMARALAAGMVRAGLIDSKKVSASDPHAAAREAFSRDVAGAQTSSDNADVVAAADIVFLATKPDYIEAVLTGLKQQLDSRHLVVSIAAGVSLEKIRCLLEPGPRLIRVMPNTPCLIGLGASAYSLGPAATENDALHVEQLLSSVGIALRLDEKLLDAVTGLSGSGPALVYVMVEALADGGVRMGLPRDVALRLAAQTVRGAAGMVAETGEHPSVLKDRVASPAGTTIAGLKALENGGLRATLIEAVEAATKRSIELGSC